MKSGENPPGSTDNLGTISETSLSIANYRKTPFSLFAQCNDGVDNDGNGFVDYPDDPGCTSLTDETEDSVALPPGSCGLTAPVVVSGMITGICVPTAPYTEHYVWWIDACPSASTHYQVWYSQGGV